RAGSAGTQTTPKGTGGTQNPARWTGSPVPAGHAALRSRRPMAATTSPPSDGRDDQPRRPADRTAAAVWDDRATITPRDAAQATCAAGSSTGHEQRRTASESRDVHRGRGKRGRRRRRAPRPGPGGRRGPCGRPVRGRELGGRVAAAGALPPAAGGAE